MLVLLEGKYCWSHRHHNCIQGNVVVGDARGQPPGGEVSSCPDENTALCYHFCSTPDSSLNTTITLARQRQKTLDNKNKQYASSAQQSVNFGVLFQLLISLSLPRVFFLAMGQTSSMAITVARISMRNSSMNVLYSLSVKHSLNILGHFSNICCRFLQASFQLEFFFAGRMFMCF